MALSIQSNAASKSIQTQLQRTNNNLSTALERLGSGFKVNSAKDDAAGLQIATRLNAQLKGQEAAIYNANNANAMLQTAEGAFEEMTNIAYRIKEISTQAANGTNSTAEYTSFNKELVSLTDELKSIMANTTFGAGVNLFATSATGAASKLGASLTFQVGANSAETLDINISSQLTSINTTIGDTASTTLASATLTATATAAENQATAKEIIASVDTLITNIGDARSQLGATMNRLDHTINNLQNMSQNTTQAVGQIMDADFAKETSNMTKQQLLLNSGVSVLTASNSTTQMIGSLLR